MSSKSRLFSVLALFFAGTVAIAAPRAPYRIVLRDGSSVLSSDRPRPMGSVVVFRKYPGRTLTGVPAEMVAQVRTGVATSVAAAGPAAPLQPGEVVDIGLTAPGGAGTGSSDASVVGKRPALAGGVYNPGNPAMGNYGGGGPNTAGTQFLTPSGVTAPATLNDTARALSGEPPNLEQPIGPNGFPTTGAATTPQIGPNGQPILSPAGSPGSTQPVIGPNGTPVLAPSGAPGSTPPAIGPNGTPVLAPPGAPGSAQPTTAPNGTPAAKAPGK